MFYEADVTMSLLRLRSEIAAVRVLKSAARVALLLKANFNPNQPRVPAGNPDGGQWTSVGGSSSEAGTSDGKPSRGPLRITVRPRGVGDNGDPPLELPPTIPASRPPTRRDENRLARAAVRWLARAALRQVAGPVGTYLTIVEAATWLHEHLPNMQSYFDSPKTLDELRAAAREPEKGYDIHHIVEQASAREYGFPEAVIDAPENLVRVPRYKHWELNSWYETGNEDFGGLTPRSYLQDKGWSERDRVGLDALRKFGVLKP